MYISTLCGVAILPWLTQAFSPSSHVKYSLDQRVSLKCQHGKVLFPSRTGTSLYMAFDKEKPTNMFDGPMALTKERDACGVGFIANTKTGGM